MNTFFKGIITSVVVFISLSRAGQGIAERRSDVDSGDVGYTISVERNTEVTQDKEGVNKDTALEVREGIEKSSSIPVLREGPGQPASQELVSKILGANKFWLHPDVKHLSYTFSMKHTNADDLWKATVKFTGPDQLTVIPVNGEKFEGKVDDTYDPDNNAHPPRLTTILQGVKFFGPMHQFPMIPEEHALFVVGEESLKGNNVYIMHLKPIGEPSQNAIERWERRIRKNAMHSKYMYEFLPVEKEINSVKQVVIEIKTRYNEGPSWEYIKAAHNTNSAQIKWGGKIITADIRNYRGKERPVIVLDRDPDFQGESPIRGITFEGGVDNMTLKLVLGEGEEIFDEEIYNKEKTTLPKPERGLPMRIGCGVWKLSYGYAGHGVKIDQIWVDKTTGNILREEGFNKEHECSFIVEYGDFETITGGRQVPRHIVVTLNGKNDEYFHLYPWVFDMKFMTYGRTVWLLKRLEEFQDTKEPVAIAEVFDVTLKPDSVKEIYAEEKVIVDRKDVKTSDDINKLVDDVRIIEIARAHLFREKPDIKEEQLGEPSINLDFGKDKKLVRVDFPIVSDAVSEESEGATHTTYPTIVVYMDWSGKPVSIEKGSRKTILYQPKELEERIKNIDEKLEWQSILFQLSSHNPMVVREACQIIEKMGKGAIPELIFSVSDTRPMRFHVYRSGPRGELFRGEWQIGLHPKDTPWTIGDLCLNIACDLIEYPVLYTGPDGMTEEELERFRIFTQLIIKEWHEKHKDKPHVLTMSKEEKEYYHKIWREAEKRSADDPKIFSYED